VQQAVPAISWCTTADRDVGENMRGRCWPAGQEPWWLTGMPVIARCSATVRKERPGYPGSGVSGACAQKVHGAVQDERQSGGAGGAGADTGAVYPGADHPVPAGGAEATIAPPVRQTADGGVPCVAEHRRKNECAGRGAARCHLVCAEAVSGADDVPG
jgi:hypothetical protein